MMNKSSETLFGLGRFSFRVLICLGFYALLCDAQLSVLFGTPEQADNCKVWGPYGPCIWIKSGKAPPKDPRRSHRWDRRYFDQLRPGKLGCRNHVFFRIVRKRWGTAFNNVFGYLKKVTTESKPCGMCSYQQSCGRGCDRTPIPGKTVNQLFVAERLCRAEQLGGHRQDFACSTAYAVNDCDLWPSPQVKLPNVTKAMKALIKSFEFVNCIKQKRPSGRKICRCCCHPYEPDPLTYKCVPKKGYGEFSPALKIDD